jgi:hypothetical protein
MRTVESHSLQLSPDAIANAAFPFDARLEHARRFLTSRGISEPRPLYGARARSISLNARLGARPGAAADLRRAANDDANAAPARRTPSAA